MKIHKKVNKDLNLVNSDKDLLQQVGNREFKDLKLVNKIELKKLNYLDITNQ